MRKKSYPRKLVKKDIEYLKALGPDDIVFVAVVDREKTEFFH